MNRMCRLCLLLLPAALAAGCADPPNLPAPPPVSGPPPVILPLDQVLAEAEAIGAAPPPDAALAARAARLRARAAGI